MVMLNKHQKVSILLVYVDDTVIIGDDENEITRLKKKLSKEFGLKELEKLILSWV